MIHKNYIIMIDNEEFGTAGGNFYDDGECLLYFSKMVLKSCYRDCLPPFFDVHEVDKDDYKKIYARYNNCYFLEIDNFFLNIKDDVEYLLLDGAELYYEWVDHDKE